MMILSLWMPKCRSVNINGSQPGYSPTGSPPPTTGPLAWHTYVPAYLAESNNELAFSTNKSTALGVDWTNYIAGPSLEIMKKYLDQAEAETFIPYAPTLGKYITADDAKARYANIQKWYAAHNQLLGWNRRLTTSTRSTRWKVPLWPSAMKTSPICRQVEPFR